MTTGLLKMLKDTALCLQRAGGETHHVAVSPDSALPLVTAHPPSTHRVVWTPPPLPAAGAAKRRPLR